MTDPSKPFTGSALPMPLPPWSMPFPQSYDQDHDYLIAAHDEALPITDEIMELVAILDDPDRVDQESVPQSEVIVIDDDDDEPELSLEHPSVVSVKHRKQCLSASVVASTMMGYLNAADSSSVGDLEDDFKISPEMFDVDEGDYYKFDGDGGFELVNELSDPWFANDDQDDFLCTASVDNLIRDNNEVGFVCSITGRSESASFDNLDLGEETLESWANQFGLSLDEMSE
jgi:hypothetical protein